MKNATFLSRNPICSILQTLCRPFMFYIMCFQCLILSKIICYQSLSRLLSGSNILGRPSWIMQIWQSSTNLIHTDFWYVILGPFLSRKMMVWFLLQFVQGWPPFCRRLTGLQASSHWQHLRAVTAITGQALCSEKHQHITLNWRLWLLEY